MKITPRVISDFAKALEWLERSSPQAGTAPRTKPGVFSISFGSLPALRVAADPSYADRISHLVCFGGFASLTATLDYCMTGDNRDPLNQPAAFINLLDYIEDVPGDPQTLVDAWLSYMDRTWGRPEMKDAERHTPIAHELAQSVPDEQRQLFLIGTGHEPGGLALARPALARMGEAAAFFDPRPHLGGVRCPVTIVHGQDDDVIPSQQARDLAEALADADNNGRTEMVITGLYDHTRPASDIGKLAREGSGMWKILRAIALGYRTQVA